MRNPREAGASNPIGDHVRQKTWALETGAATVLMVAFVASLVALATLMGIVSMKSLEQARLQVTADNSAIAGADALRGLVAGYPCDVVRSMNAHITACEVIGTDVLVTLTINGLTATARAGEPN